MVRARYFWLPNAISLFRLCLVPLYVILLLSTPPHHYHEAFIVALIMIVSDKVDGTLARRLHVESDLGSVLDNVADSSFIVLSWLAFYFHDLFAFPVLVLLLAPRIFMGVSIIAYRLRKHQWNVEHFVGGKIAGVSHFIAILWILSGLSYSLFVLFIAILFNVTGSLISEIERHTRTSL